MDLQKVAEKAASIVDMLAPVAETLDPALAPALTIAQKVVHGVIAGVPEAIALYNQIKSGSQPTPEQLIQFEADYEDAYQQLQADIRAKLGG